MPINRAPFNALVDDDGSGVVGTVWNKTQIQSVLLDPIDALVGGLMPQQGNPWYAFTPTWSNIGGSVQPNIGNGTLAGRWAIFGKTVHFTIVLVAGSTTTFGDASYWAWSLPANAVAFNGVTNNFASVAVLVGTGLQHGLSLAYDASHIWLYTAAGGQVGPNIPWTWANGYTIAIRGTYEGV